MKKRVLSVLLVLVLALSLCLVTAVPVAANGGTPTIDIDGVIATGEWDGALEIPVKDGMGTVKLLASTDYLYVLFDVMDSTDARLDENTHGNDQTSININPTPGDTNWGMPCDIVFQTGADPDAFTTPDPDIPGSSGNTDGWETEWVINGEQLDLPEDLETMTLYDYGTGTRISEWKIPLTTINPSAGDILDVAGSYAPGDVGLSGSYCYPPELGIGDIPANWGDLSIYVDYSFIVENETTGLYYQTIQAAINAATGGDTVNVAAGEYEENVVVDKMLTLQGEDRETTIIESPSETLESTLTISADGVTVSGFTIHSKVYQHGIEYTIDVQGNSVQLTDLHVIKDKPVGGAAVIVRPGVDGFAFTDSTVDSEWNGVYVPRHLATFSSNILIQKVNFNYPGEWAVLLVAMEGAKIEENLFNCETHYGIVTNACDNIEILNNQFVGSDTANLGIWPQGFAGPVGNVTIRGNDISGFNTGILVEDVATSGISIHGNNITGNAAYGVNYLGSETIDATNNWWGTTSGVEILMMVSGNVIYEPWLSYEVGSMTGSGADLTAKYSVAPLEIGISLDTTSVDFGAVEPGVASGPQPIRVTNIGNVAEDFTASLDNISSPDVYTAGLEINTYLVADWGEANVPANEVRSEELILMVPTGTAPGTYTATLIFWAEAAQ